MIAIEEKKETKSPKTKSASYLDTYIPVFYRHQKALRRATADDCCNSECCCMLQFLSGSVSKNQELIGPYDCCPDGIDM